MKPAHRALALILFGSVAALVGAWLLGGLPLVLLIAGASLVLLGLLMEV